MITSGDLIAEMPGQELPGESVNEPMGEGAPLPAAPMQGMMPQGAPQ